MTVPNVITLVRLVLVPVIVLLMLDHAWLAAFLVFVAAGVSDGIDGAIARWVPGQASELGAWLDPVADKAMLVASFVTLGAIGAVPLWLVVLAVSRDLLIVGGVMLASLLANPVPIAPSRLSKANTVAQILLVAAVLAERGPGWGLPVTVHVLVWIVAALTAASAAAYLIAWFRHMKPGTA